MKKTFKCFLLSVLVLSLLVMTIPYATVSAKPLMEITKVYKPPPEVQPPEEIPWGIDRVNAIPAASAVDESSVIVAILDTGMDLDHPDLAANYIWGWDLVKDDPSPDDENGHGTHCAGTVAAIDNDIGVIGVAPNVGLYIIRVLNPGGLGTYEDIADGIIMATNGPDGIPGTADDADVISMSLSGPSPDPYLESAVNYALSYDVVIVAATGNDGADEPAYPAAYPGVIKAGATDIDDNIASWSNRGETILAPGVSVYSTYLNGHYITYSGTSMATPHVAGVVALAWAAHPDYSGEQIRLLVEGSADDAGVVNAMAVI
ncbi:MAG: S8 family peptidase [Candidatus Odinarchaeota archaeon]